MKLLFVDTSGWKSCADEDDPLHSKLLQARNAALESGLHLLTTDYIVDETLTLLRTRLGLRAARKWWDFFEASRRVKLELITRGQTEKAREMFFRYRDKNFSFTDCTSFVLMKELKIRQALTTDRHFRQMGFEMVGLSGK